MTPETAMLNTPTRAPSPPVLSICDHVATLTLNRPEQRNRLDGGDLHTLLDQFEQINANPDIRVLTFTANTQGQPRPVFCAGYHLGSFSDHNSDPKLFEHVANALAALRPITVCALNGSVYGGATDLMLACDLSVGLTGIEFRMPATALGLHYYPGGLQRYVARLGLSGAKRAFLSARPFTADMLWRMECLEALVGQDEFDATVNHLVRDIAELAPLAVQATKQSLIEIAAGCTNLEAMRARETATALSQDFAEGQQAFQAKRKPKFVGK